ncbi:lysophospholipid acyltransferase family protein [Maioricimonas sp. JC845]|uniref:lysophospholipid acyltransferase family protein n=1 Tax=Maioricimonas sp. JC845 TaxID=3232138 RepID=UPI003458C8F5
MFTYATEVDAPWKKRMVRVIERATGSGRLNRIYQDRHALLAQGLDPWSAAVRLMDLMVDEIGYPIDQVPQEGPLVVVANHPYGLIDGMILCHLVGKVRPNFRILINAVLEQVEEIRPWLLPIDFRETREAMATNIRSRAEAIRFLQEGGAVVIFPSGGVSTARRAGFGKAIDADWKTFTSKLIRASSATVLPVYFHGQNSRLFQFASHVSMTLRLALLTHEVKRQCGRRVQVVIGEPIPPEQLTPITCRQELVEHLRHVTYSLERQLPSKKHLRKPR